MSGCIFPYIGYVKISFYYTGESGWRLHIIVYIRYRIFSISFMIIWMHICIYTFEKWNFLCVTYENLVIDFSLYYIWYIPDIWNRVLCDCELFFSQSCLTLCEPMYCHTPGFPVFHYLPSVLRLLSIKSAMPSNHLTLSSPSPALSLSRHQGLFQWVSSSHEVAKVSEFQLQHQSLQLTPRTDLL